MKIKVNYFKILFPLQFSMMPLSEDLYSASVLLNIFNITLPFSSVVFISSMMMP